MPEIPAISTWPQARPERQNWYRAVPSRHPPVQLWDHCANPEELHDAAMVESVTNDRLRQELGEIRAVPEADWVFGEGASPVMAAFCHVNEQGSRFSPGDYGVYYAGSSPRVAAREVAYHRRQWYRQNPAAEPRQTMRLYQGSVTRPLIDIRGETRPGLLHDPDSWHHAQRFGQAAKQDQSWGIHYRSVRHPGGECVALLRPPAITPVIQTRHFQLHWDGEDVQILGLG
ncbi:hypothetical protein J2T60_000815 [Natronospira proteinivora]|uniref:RES domain-containing protein n=1 Tax=Natronospira proteinivora TaxID=1807133 RepID=A0ABT1G7B9_9GAMM|nr:RES family NAD+ phosphorylase [Natronospira proteinivora]MCP1726850.1 hypothetical protein [Natronospira proteinivora]